MAARLLLIAHAETTATRRATFPSGEGLASQGRSAAATFAVPRHDLALASPAPAARETAAALGMAAQEVVVLRDLDVGAWRGRSLADIAVEDPAGAEAFLADPAFAGHGGDSVDALIARVGTFLDERREGHGHIVAVTHVAVVRAAVLSVLAAPASAFWRIDVAPLGALAFGSDGRRWTLRAAR